MTKLYAVIAIDPDTNKQNFVFIRSNPFNYPVPLVSLDQDGLKRGLEGSIQAKLIDLSNLTDPKIVTFEATESEDL